MSIIVQGLAALDPVSAATITVLEAPPPTRHQAADIPFLADADLAVLNAARTILSEVRPPHTRSGGHVDCRANVAEHAIFMFLNIVNVHGLQHIDDNTMHNRVTEAPPEDPA